MNLVNTAGERGWTSFGMVKPRPNELCRFWNELSGAVWTDYRANLCTCKICRDQRPYLWFKLTGIQRVLDEGL